MYGASHGADGDSTVDSERTAFRKAEKRYKLYKAPTTKPRSKQSHHPLATDLSDVVDFDMVLDSYRNGKDIPPNIFAMQHSGFSKPIFCFHDHPGFYFIPGALSLEEQCHWIKESLTTFPQPPNRTNHTAMYGPLSDLFFAAQNRKILVETSPSEQNDKSNLHSSKYTFSDSAVETSCNGSPRSVPAAVLLRKLRWSTLGLQFDWSKRNYNISLPHKKIPDMLCLLANKMATPALANGEEFLPEAAIVNYFGLSDMLGGHLDDMEVDWSKPIVSISLGCKAIFLLGGKSRQDSPAAMFLRSGDIVLMAGQARECFHAYFLNPRFQYKNDIGRRGDLVMGLQEVIDKLFANNKDDAIRAIAQIKPFREASGLFALPAAIYSRDKLSPGVPRIFTDEQNSDNSALLSKLSGQGDSAFSEYIKTSRININIRQVN